ncbi:hypothetical protein PMIN02_003424 [Paraphaeosphaeria minitans]
MEAKGEQPQAEVREAEDGVVHQEGAVRIKREEIQGVEISVVGTWADNDNIKVEEEALKATAHLSSSSNNSNNPIRRHRPTSTRTSPLRVRIRRFPPLLRTMFNR